MLVREQALAIREATVEMKEKMVGELAAKKSKEDHQVCIVYCKLVSLIKIYKTCEIMPYSFNIFCFVIERFLCERGVDDPQGA